MRVKKEFILHKIDDEYTAIAVGKETQNFNGIIRINETGAYIWNLLKKDISKEEIINSVCENFEQVQRESVSSDVTEFLQTIKPALVYGENEI